MSTVHAGVLAAQLPRGSRIARRLQPAAEWTSDTYLLHSIEYSLRVLVWMKTKDAEHGRNKPKPVPLPGEKKSPEQVDRAAEHVRRKLGLDIGV